MGAGCDGLDDEVIDAALERFLQMGIRRTTLDDIAQASGVDRPIFHRRFPGKECLVDAVLTREANAHYAATTTFASGRRARLLARATDSRGGAGPLAGRRRTTGTTQHQRNNGRSDEVAGRVDITEVYAGGGRQQ